MNVARRPLQQTLYNREPGSIVPKNPLLDSGTTAPALPKLNVAEKTVAPAPAPITPKSSGMTAAEGLPVIASNVSSGGIAGAAAGVGAGIGAVLGFGVPGAVVGSIIGTGVGSLIDMFMSWNDAEAQNKQIRDANALAAKEQKRQEKISREAAAQARKDEQESLMFNRGLGMASRLRESMFSTPDFRNRLISIQKGRR